MPYWFFSGARRRVWRIVILAGRKYALFRLNTGLVRFSDARLGRWTSRAGIQRSDLFTVFKGNAAHRQLMARMLAALQCRARTNTKGSNVERTLPILPNISLSRLGKPT
jgi:hypothetical protein